MPFPNHLLTPNDEEVAKRKVEEKEQQISNHYSVGSNLLMSFMVAAIVLAVIVGIYYWRMH
ncbi:hypothetical protein [Paenibacillus gallinarum]|uniref:Uncharacterized protein n=1 Tax=Paenibacillus gallinarum TaxID=2762232 RepID=A0ABR8STH5_9BACL|nr:hypothetical protein [Paenibacillus gallinarum]MBD7966643.1 hypothetical protein [Paenibacillus gallinarum]